MRTLFCWESDPGEGFSTRPGLNLYTKRTIYLSTEKQMVPIFDRLTEKFLSLLAIQINNPFIATYPRRSLRFYALSLYWRYSSLLLSERAFGTILVMPIRRIAHAIEPTITLEHEFTLPEKLSSTAGLDECRKADMELFNMKVDIVYALIGKINSFPRALSVLKEIDRLIKLRREILGHPYGHSTDPIQPQFRDHNVYTLD